MIIVTNLVKTYGKKDSAFTALDDVSFQIPEGSTVAIVGKSGSGKSTLMHIMSGLDSPSRGSVEIDGNILTALSAKEMDKFRANEMSFIFQSFFVEPNQTAFQNVMLPLEIAKVGRRSRNSKVLAALQAVELSDKADSKAANLSGGQKQRLAIARAIVNKPQLIFADEPTGNLDSVTGDIVIELLFNINKKIGSTLIIVTHDDELAKRCNIQIKLKDGKIEKITKKSVRKPRTTKRPSTRSQTRRVI
ncbi:MAG: ABC transporter ATP-binding protein [bacterium]|nr:ABC transporter ATP-binding protein [bacterium]